MTPAESLAACSRESHMVVIERDPNGVPTIWCDPEIVDLVQVLNTGGLRTIASCSGHGEQHGNIALKDGRELLIAPDYDTARRMETALQAAMQGRESDYVDPDDVFLSQGVDDVPCLKIPGRVLARFVPGSWGRAYSMFSGNTPTADETGEA